MVAIMEALRDEIHELRRETKELKEVHHGDGDGGGGKSVYGQFVIGVAIIVAAALILTSFGFAYDAHASMEVRENKIEHIEQDVSDIRATLKSNIEANGRTP